MRFVSLPQLNLFLISFAQESKLQLRNQPDAATTRLNETLCDSQCAYKKKDVSCDTSLKRSIKI